MIFKQLFFKNDLKRVRRVQSSHKSNPWHPIKPTNPPHGTQKLSIWLMLFLCEEEIENKIFFLERERERERREPGVVHVTVTGVVGMGEG